MAKTKTIVVNKKQERQERREKFKELLLNVYKNEEGLIEEE